MSNKIAFLVKHKIDLDKIDYIESVFAKQQFTIQISQYKGQFYQLTKNVLDNGFNCIIVVGGDGSINEVANAIIEYHTKDNVIDREAMSKIKFGILPFGFGNDFARNFKKLKLKNLKEKIDSNKSCLIDVIQINYFDTETNNPKKSYVINALNLGMGPNSVNMDILFKEKFKFRLGYLLPAFRYLAKKSFINLKININGETITREVSMLSLCNGKYVGKGIQIAPRAELNNGAMDVVVVNKISLLQFTKHLPNILRGKGMIDENILYLQSEKIEVFSNNKDKLLIEVDGDVIGVLPLNAKVIPSILNVIL